MDLPVAGQTQRDEVARIMVRLGLVDMVNSQKTRIAALAAYLAAPVVAALDRHLQFLVESVPVGEKGCSSSPCRVVCSVLGFDVPLGLSRAASAAENVGGERSWGSPNGLSACLAVSPEAVGVMTPPTSLTSALHGAKVASVLGNLRRLASECLSTDLAGNSGVVVVPPPCERVLGSQLGETFGSAGRRSSSGQTCLDVDILAADRAGDDDMTALEGTIARRPAELVLVGFDATGRSADRLTA